MEQIIGLIVLIVAGAIWDLIKARAKKAAERREAQQQHRPSPVRQVIATAPAPVHAPVQAPAPSRQPVFLSGETTDAVAPAVETPLPDNAPLPDTDADADAETERWRRAIIDSEILARRF